LMFDEKSCFLQEDEAKPPRRTEVEPESSPRAIR
jgi:hypothetical protein